MYNLSFSLSFFTFSIRLPQRKDAEERSPPVLNVLAKPWKCTRVAHEVRQVKYKGSIAEAAGRWSNAIPRCTTNESITTVHDKWIHYHGARQMNPLPWWTTNESITTVHDKWTTTTVHEKWIITTVHDKWIHYHGARQMNPLPRCTTNEPLPRCTTNEPLPRCTTNESITTVHDKWIHYHGARQMARLRLVYPGSGLHCRYSKVTGKNRSTSGEVKLTKERRSQCGSGR